MPALEVGAVGVRTDRWLAGADRAGRGGGDVGQQGHAQSGRWRPRGDRETEVGRKVQVGPVGLLGAVVAGDGHEGEARALRGLGQELDAVVRLPQREQQVAALNSGGLGDCVAV